MKKILAVVSLSLLLTACANIPNPFTKSRIDALNASWGTALSVADGYYNTCERRLIAASCRTVVAKMHAAAKIIHPKVKNARNYAANPTLSTVDLIAVASAAVDDFIKLQTSLGVK